MTYPGAYNIQKPGWIKLTGDIFIVSNKFTLLSGVNTNFPDQNFTDNGQFIDEDVYDPPTAIIEPDNTEDFNTIVVAFNASPPGGAGNFIECTLDVSAGRNATNDSEGLLYCLSLPLLNPAPLTQCMTYTMNVDVTQDFKDNGGLIRIQSSVDVDLFDFVIKINRTFNPR